MKCYGYCYNHQYVCVQAHVTIHTSPPGSLCSPPLPGSCDPGTTSPGEHSTSGWCNVTPASATASSPRIPYPSLPPVWMCQSSRISCYFNPVLSEQTTDAHRWPTCRGGAISKAEPQELWEQRREREISPSSLRRCGLNLHNQLDVPCISAIPE